MFPTFLSFTERHPRYIALIGVSFFLMGVTLYGFYYLSSKNSGTLVTETIEEVGSQKPFEPLRTEFGADLPTNFPTSIPIEEGALNEQSYSLAYPGQKQLTIVFPSTKTVNENYLLYIDFLTTDMWTVVSSYENDSIATLYAMKDNNDINITITAEQVSISVLKRE